MAGYDSTHEPMNNTATLNLFLCAIHFASRWAYACGVALVAQFSGKEHDVDPQRPPANRCASLRPACICPSAHRRHPSPRRSSDPPPAAEAGASEAAALAFLDAAFALGINAFDVAPTYGAGAAETTLGRWLHARSAGRARGLGLRVLLACAKPAWQAAGHCR